MGGSVVYIYYLVWGICEFSQPGVVKGSVLGHLFSYQLSFGYLTPFSRVLTLNIPMIARLRRVFPCRKAFKISDNSHAYSHTNTQKFVL